MPWPSDSPHDFRALMRRWKCLARRAGLRFRVLLEHDGFPVPVFFSAAWEMEEAGALYISAGIHGDEPAGTEALCTWAEAEGSGLCARPVLLLPCLNPWGLRENSRRDASGCDLNRAWGDARHPLVRAVKSLVARRRVALALTLHEDFDGRGFYLYEPTRFHSNRAWGGRILSQVMPILPVDPRSRIDKRVPTAPGIIRRRLMSASALALEPEALWLHYEIANRTFTFETPSEFALEKRVAAQVAAIRAAVDLADAIR